MAYTEKTNTHFYDGKLSNCRKHYEIILKTYDSNNEVKKNLQSLRSRITSDLALIYYDRMVKNINMSGNDSNYDPINKYHAIPLLNYIYHLLNDGNLEIASLLTYQLEDMKTGFNMDKIDTT